VPFVGQEALGQRVEHRVARRPRDVEPADLRGARAPHLRAGRRRQQLGAQADAERRQPGLHRVAQQLDLAAEPRQAVGVADVHATAEDDQGAEVVQRRRHVLPATWVPLDQLVPCGRGAAGQEAAAAAARMQHAEDSHLGRSLAG